VVEKSRNRWRGSHIRVLLMLALSAALALGVVSQQSAARCGCTVERSQGCTNGCW
jgi:hypothetical protein